MKKQLLSFAMAAAVVSMSLSNANAQTGNVGIGTSTPTNKLDVLAPTNPLRLRAVQAANDPDVLTIDSAGVVHKVAKSSLSTSAPANSQGYVNTCGCNNVAVVALSGSFVNDDPFGDVDISGAVIAGALSDPNVCDIAITLPAINISGNGTYVNVILPNPALYSGRIFTIHFALPYTVTGSGNLQIVVQAHNWIGTAGGTSGVPGLLTMNNSLANVQNSSVQAASYFGQRVAPTTRILSDGNQWTANNLSSPCVVMKPL